MSDGREEIPFLDLKTLHRELADEILAAWRDILHEAAFIGGREVEGLEEEFAAFVGVPHCVGVGSGTDALRLIFQGLGLGAGDEVVTVPHTFIATTEAISQVGARPVFVDVDRESGCMDPGLLEAAITSRTRLVVPVHLYGQSADMDPIREIAGRHGIPVVEDACQAHGAEYRGERAGAMGVAAAFSFYPGKNLGACGEAGAITTRDAALAERLRVLRDHGQAAKYHHSVEGTNARLDALQAAVLRIKLRRLAGWTKERRGVAEIYGRELASSGLELPKELPGSWHVYHLYVVRHPRRDEIRSALDAAGIRTGLHYPIPLHLQPAYAGRDEPAGSFPESERWASTGLSLPMFPGMTAAQAKRVCDVINGLGLESD